MRLVTKAHERTAQIMTTRIEQDPLGELEVPNHALLGFKHNGQLKTSRLADSVPILRLSGLPF